MSEHRPLKSGDHVYLIDGSGYIFRAYHALPPLTRKSDGLPVGAVTGFCNMLWKLLKEMKAGEKPTHLAVIFDKSEQTFRKRIYPDYKAHRPDPPADLIPQFGLIRQATRDIEPRFQFNTAIAAVMELVNEIYRLKGGLYDDPVGAATVRSASEMLPSDF